MRIFFSLLLFAFAFNLSAQLNMQLIGQLPYQGTLAGCWHYFAPDGTPYALMGTSSGLSIVDMSDPAQPTEVQHVPGLPNNWREVRTYGEYAYVTTEQDGSGVQIVDMSGLPDTVTYFTWTGNAGDSVIARVHALGIEEGYLYLYGGNTGTNGATICDLANPEDPQVLGRYTLNYIHDGYVRNDTLWASEIYKGQFSVVDVSDKSNPILLASTPTPGAFNHNSMLSDDSRFLFTTDERPDTPLGSFDVSNLDNITLLDTYYPSQKPSAEVHNVRVFGRYLVNACYGGQITIVDAAKPDNLVEVAWAVPGSALVWDAIPYLSDSVIFASDKISGLFVFRPTYTPAAWLEGKVRDAETMKPILGASIDIQAITLHDTTDVDGIFKTGTAIAGSYDVVVSKAGYYPHTMTNVVLENDKLTEIEIALTPLPVSSSDLKNELAVDVWPTVFEHSFTVKIPESIDEVHLQLFDANGKLVLEKTVFGKQYRIEDLGRLAKGNYYLYLKTVDGRQFSQVLTRQ